MLQPRYLAGSCSRSHARWSFPAAKLQMSLAKWHPAESLWALGLERKVNRPQRNGCGDGSREVRRHRGASWSRRKDVSTRRASSERRRTFQLCPWVRYTQSFPRHCCHGCLVLLTAPCLNLTCVHFKISRWDAVMLLSCRGSYRDEVQFQADLNAQAALKARHPSSVLCHTRGNACDMGSAGVMLVAWALSAGSAAARRCYVSLCWWMKQPVQKMMK